MYLRVSVCTSYIRERAWGAQQKASAAPELQLRAAVSHSMGMLGLSSGPGEEQRVLLGLGISPAPQVAS